MINLIDLNCNKYFESEEKKTKPNKKEFLDKIQRDQKIFDPEKEGAVKKGEQFYCNH